jgi:hypothetical protein
VIALAAAFRSSRQVARDPLLSTSGADFGVGRLRHLSGLPVRVVSWRVNSNFLAGIGGCLGYISGTDLGAESGMRVRLGDHGGVGSGLLAWLDVRIIRRGCLYGFVRCRCHALSPTHVTASYALITGGAP